jgi:Zn-dependent alcohol dehydrogenase
VGLTEGGADYSFECVGNTTLMRRLWSAVIAAGDCPPAVVALNEGFELMTSGESIRTAVVF